MNTQELAEDILTDKVSAATYRAALDKTDNETMNCFEDSEVFAETSMALLVVPHETVSDTTQSVLLGLFRKHPTKAIGERKQ